jgi:hypothetical protein
MLGRRISGTALYAYLSESNTCRIRTEIFSFILPVSADIPASSINDYPASQISLDFSKFH